MIDRRTFLQGGAALALTPILPAVPLTGISRAEWGNDAVMAFANRSRETSMEEARMMVQAMIEMHQRHVLWADDALARAVFAYYDNLAFELWWYASPEGKTVDQYVNALTRAYQRSMRYLEPHKGRASLYAQKVIKPLAPYYYRLAQEREAKIWGKQIDKVEAQA
jgi:hypothetical protein